MHYIHRVLQNLVTMISSRILIKQCQLLYSSYNKQLYMHALKLEHVYDI